LPGFPRKIGVATSETGAVFHDIVTILKRRYPVDILFVPTIVQGENAASSIVRSIELLNRTEVDLIIIGRGGGSIEDLWAFNEEAVARAIYNSEKPIISAVGHETDYTIADFVADKRAPTPSAAAEIAVPERKELLAKINRLIDRLIQNQRRSIAESISYLDDITQRQTVSINRILEAKKEQFSACTGKLDAVSPLGTLSRGYSITLKLPESKLVRSIGDVAKTDKVQIIVNDGKIMCDVKDKEVFKWK
ncbi:MAG: exodeoxyribonuclease VII large subunit, partial [Candidatus Methanoperedens sp.]|nr:exodeoxyribonuclease VII large subunit [Candidatus Methanoperedens sp.]